MIKKILLYGIVVIVLIVAIFCVVVAMQPAHYTVERSGHDQRARAGGVRAGERLSQMAGMVALGEDRSQHEEGVFGAAAGNGAVYSWAGNNDVGEGRMTITDSHPSDNIKIKLEFVKAVHRHERHGFHFHSAGQSTNVKWTMSGDNNFVAKAFSMFMNMDKMVGGDFEKGLAQMKTVSEAAAK